MLTLDNQLAQVESTAAMYVLGRRVVVSTSPAAHHTPHHPLTNH